MNSQHVKVSETLHKSARQYFCRIFSLLWNIISSKNSLLVVSEILRLFVNILTPDDKYSLSVKGVFNATNSNAYISKWKNIFWIFFCISFIYIKFVTLWKKKMASEVICYWNYKLQKAALLKCPKSPVSEHLWALNMLKCPKDFLNLHGNIFIIFSDQSELKSAPRTLF